VMARYLNEILAKARSNFGLWCHWRSPLYWGSNNHSEYQATGCEQSRTRAVYTYLNLQVSSDWVIPTLFCINGVGSLAPRFVDQIWSTAKDSDEWNLCLEF
jgi:hypothetical protein